MAAPRKRRTTKPKETDVTQDTVDVKAQDQQEPQQDAPVEQPSDTKQDVVVEPVKEEVVTEDTTPKPEEVVVEEPVKDAQPQEEPVTDDTAVAEEPVTEESVTEDPVTEDAAPEPEETVVEDPAVVEQPVQEPQLDAPVEEVVEVSDLEDDVSHVTGVKALVSDQQHPPADKLKHIALNADLKYSCAANVIRSHAAEMAPDAIEHEPGYVIGKLYNLERSITHALLCSDDVERVALLGIVECGFAGHGGHGEGFSYDKLVRYTEYWRWDESALHAAILYAKVFSDLCDTSTRAELAAGFDLTVGGKVDPSLVDQDALAALKTHFGIQ